MKLYAIRHGESETNIKGCYTGWEQVSLTEKGVSDAQGVRTLLEGVPFDRVYTSDLIRAKQTAENALPGRTYEETALLREINVGSLAFKPMSVLTAEKKLETDSCGFGEYGGESRETFRGRVHSFLKMVEALHCDNVAAFSHAGWLRLLFDEVVGIMIPRSAVICSNCTVAIFECKNGQWRLHSWINSQ